MPPSRSRTRTRSPSLGTKFTNNSSSRHARAHLSPTTLSVPASRVRKHWRPLPQPNQDRIRTLLLAIQATSQSNHHNRTTKNRSTNNPAKIPLSSSDHDEAITTLTQKLISRLPKMHFPPSGTKSSAAAAAAAQDLDFDYDATLHRTATPSARLTEATQSARLLRASIRQEEADLRAERDELAALQENLKRSVAAQRGLDKRLHPLARALDDDDEPSASVKHEEADAEGVESIADATLGNARRRRRADGTAGPGLTAAEIEADDELNALAGQMRSHLGSMAANTASLAGVRGELGGAEAAVAAFAWRGMGRDKYERVMGVD